MEITTGQFMDKNILQEFGITEFYHYTPLHYLPFIARDKALFSKPELLDLGFGVRHFRSKSKTADQKRGFGNFIHTTLHPFPNILQAKLNAGFPHIQICIPSNVVAENDFVLCRYNIAMTRFLRANGKQGFPESASSGKYYGSMQIPIAKSLPEKRGMLSSHLPKGTMIEVLFERTLPLPDDIKIMCFHKEDQSLADQILLETKNPWKTRLDVSKPYQLCQSYSEQVKKFSKVALADPSWRGDGLEYDDV